MKHVFRWLCPFLLVWILAVAGCSPTDGMLSSDFLDIEDANSSETADFVSSGAVSLPGESSTEALVEDKASSMPETSKDEAPSISSSSEPERSPSASEVEPPTVHSEEPVGCIHVYEDSVVAPTCTEEGYTVHICQICGKSYTDSFIAPQHEIGKYTCIRCGKPDPDQTEYSIGAWLKERGEISLNGRFYQIVKIIDGEAYCVSSVVTS